MKKLIPFLSVVALWPGSVQAQVYPANKDGVSLSHWHTLVRDVEAAKKVWVALGGKAMKIDGTDVVKFPGVFVFLQPGSPTAGTRGSAINHVGLGSEDVEKLFAKIQVDGVQVDKTTLRKSPLNAEYLFDVNTPDGVMIEVTSERGKDPYPKLPPGVPVESNHIHMFVSQAVRKDMQDWYVKTFGGEPWERRGEYIVTLPGVQFFRIAPCGSEYSACPASGSAPTKGRALDHVGFEVKNLEAFSKKLEAENVKFTQPYSKTRHKSFASVEFTDPWGTSLELTEGLARF